MRPVENRTTPVSGNSQRVGIKLVDDAFRISSATRPDQGHDVLLDALSAPQPGDEALFADADVLRRGVIISVHANNNDQPRHVEIRFERDGSGFTYGKRTWVGRFHNLSAVSRVAAMIGAIGGAA